jgi:protein SCO1/2
MGLISMKIRIAALSALLLGMVLAVLAFVFEPFSSEGRQYPITGEFSSGRHEVGLISPSRPLPPIELTLDDGTKVNLVDFAKGRWTIAQLMFTSCSTTCPIQGAIFQQADKSITAGSDKIAMLSISIDPVGDSPESMARWLDSFDASQRWRGGIPDLNSLPLLAETLKGTGSGVDIHDTRVYFFEPSGSLIYATEDLPSADSIVRLVEEALRGPPTN